VLRLVLPLSLALSVTPRPLLATSVSEHGAALAPIVVPIASQANAPAADRVSELLPKAAVAVLRARSAQTLIDDANLFTGAESEDRFTAESLFEPLGVSEISSKVALDRPLGVALVIDEGMQPQVWAAVPVLDAAGLIAAIPPESGLKAFDEGDYVLVGAGLARPEGGAALATAGGDDVAVEVDLARVFETYGMLIEQGLSMAEAQLDAEMGEDPAAAELATEQLSRAREVIDSARALKLALRTTGSRVEFLGALTIGEGSPMTEWVPEKRLDLSRAAALIDPRAMMSFVAYQDPTHDGFGQLGLIESIKNDVPPQLAGLLDLELRMLRELGPKMTGLSAFSADLGAGGLRACSYVESKQPAELIGALGKLLMAPEFAQLGIEIEPSAPREIAGKNWAEFRLRLDIPTLIEAFGETDEPIPAEDLADAERALAAILGPDGLRIGVTEHAGMVVYHLGGDDAYVAKSIQRIGSQPSNLSPGLGNAFANARSVQTGFLGQMDLGRLMNQVADLSRTLGEPMELPTEMIGNSFPLTVHVVADGLVWRGGLELDAADLARFVEAMEKGDAPAPPTPAEDPADDDEDH
jgi:hypothetical protein